MYSPWTGGNMDEGWTRWVLEQYDFNLTTLHNADDPGGQAARQVRRHHPARPERRARSSTAPAGRTSGPSTAAASATRASPRCSEFVGQGGTLVTLGAASDLAIERFGVPREEPEGGPDARSALRAGHDPQRRSRHGASDRLRHGGARPTASTTTARSSASSKASRRRSCRWSRATRTADVVASGLAEGRGADGRAAPRSSRWT